MTDIDNLHREVSSSVKNNNLPPVEKWNPPLSGEMDLLIKANGEWWHEGGLIKRQALVKLLASILKKEGDEYFLVSPTEKWRIQVEEVPLLVTEVVFHNQGAEKQIEFTTATDDSFILAAEHPLYVKDADTEPRPYVLVRNDLYALIHRNVFYQLAEQAKEKEGEYGVESAGEFFRLS